MASGLQMTSGNHSLAPRAQLVRPGTKPFLSSPVQCTSLAIAPVAGHLHVSPSGGQGQTRPVVGKREKLMMSASSFHPTLRYLGRHLPSQAISTQAQCSHLCQARFVPSRSFLPGWALLVPLLVQLHRTEATALSHCARALTISASSAISGSSLRDCRTDPGSPKGSWPLSQ